MFGGLSWDRPKDRVFAVLLLSTLASQGGWAILRSIFPNFAAQEFGLGPGQYGWLEGIREVPGLLTIILAATTVYFTESRLLGLCIATMGLGMFLYAGAGSYLHLVAATLVQSVGFHLWYPVQNAMAIHTGDEGERGARLGKLNAWGAAAASGGMVLVWALSALLGLRGFFVLGGAVTVVGAAITLLLPREHDPARRKRAVFRRAYMSYYVLMLLNGARRHVVLTFAAFALVKLHGVQVTTMALLLLAHSVLAIWTRPYIGKVIDRLGEQRALALNYATIAALFTGYALVPWAPVVYLIFVADNLMMGFDIAITTHAARLVPRQDLVPTLSMGSSINHITGVAVPVVGGLLWEHLGPVVPFLLGAGGALAAMAYSLTLDRRTPGRLAPASQAQ